MTGLHSMTGLLAVALAAHAGAQVEFYDFPLSGAQEVPPVPTLASGFATLEYDPTTRLFDLVLGVEGIELAAIASAHIHAAPRGQNGPIIIDLLGLGEFVDASDGLSLLLLNDVSLGGMTEESLLRAGGLYVNVHSSQYPGGEIRGQIVPAPGATACLLLTPLALRRRRRGA